MSAPTLTRAALPDVGDVLARFRALAAQGTPEQMADGLGWYDAAAHVAADVATELGTDLAHGATVVAAFSPRTPWARNVSEAMAFARGEHVPGLQSRVRDAHFGLQHGYLTGPKVGAFARAIAGDPDAVVVDSHMVHAAGWPDRDMPTTRQRRAIVEAVERLAGELGMSPRDCQAYLWCVQRGASF